MPRDESWTDDKLIAEARRVLKVEAEAVSALAGRVDSGFVLAVTLVAGSSGRVIVTGMGKSGLIGQKIAATLSSTGTPAFFMHPGEASHGDLGMVTSGDVVIAISNSGETGEITQILPFLKRFGVRLVAMTGKRGSTLGRAADAVLDVSVAEEACSLGIVPTASTTAALAMGDALAVALLRKRGFNEEEFAAFHPGGSLGKQLLTRVADLMHTGESIPRVAAGTRIALCVIEISSKRLGLATVVDEDGRLLGVITDGDLRRGIERWGEGVFGMAAGEVMSMKPKTIGSGELAALALAMMQEHSITAIVVPDAQGRPQGVIHIHDILKEGIY